MVPPTTRIDRGHVHLFHEELRRENRLQRSSQSPPPERQPANMAISLTADTNASSDTAASRNSAFPMPGQKNG